MSADDRLAPASGIVLYRTEDGQTRLECRFEDDTIWLTQAMMAELFQTTVANINIHLRSIYAGGELEEDRTVKSYLMVRLEGARKAANDSERVSAQRRAEREAIGEAEAIRHLEAVAKAVPNRARLDKPEEE